MDEEVAAIIHSQDALGWDAACFGIVSKAWSYHQGGYLVSLGKRVSGTTWVSRFIRQLWSAQHKMWLHRNTFVHGSGKRGHELEVEAVDTSIRLEFLLGRDRLSHDYYCNLGLE